MVIEPTFKGPQMIRKPASKRIITTLEETLLWSTYFWITDDNYSVHSYLDY